MSRYTLRSGINRAYSNTLIDNFIARQQESKPRVTDMKSNTVTRVVTRVHTPRDNGNIFTDNLGREYVYTTNGLIY